MSKAVDIINAMSAPANKLIDAVTGAIGKAYEPRHVRKMVDAKVYEINAIGQALRDNADIQINYDRQTIAANTGDFEEFLKRTSSRLVFQELHKQHNIESVTDKAYEILVKETECSSEPVNKDWMIRFFNSVEDISDEEMQLLWAKLLAGEIKRPKTFSLRTLETLRNLTQAEAKLFEYVSAVVVFSKSEGFIPENDDLLENYKITFGDLLTLSECGLVSSIAPLDAYEKIPADNKTYSVFYGKNKAINATNYSSEPQQITISAFPLSRIGEELFRLFDSGMSDNDLLDIIKYLNYDKEKIKIHIN